MSIEKIAGGQRVALPGYRGIYEISSDGCVFSLSRLVTRTNRDRQQVVSYPAKKLSRGYSRKGYPQVGLSKNGKHKTAEIHRLVCRAFHGEPVTKDLEVAHLDGDKNNASAENLAWVTRSENHSHKKLHGTFLRGESVPNAKLTSSDAKKIVLRANSGVSKRQIGRDFSVSDKTVRKIVNGEMWEVETRAVRAHLAERAE